MSSFAPTELEAFVRQRAPEIAQEITRVAEQAGNEADLVAEVEQLLKRFEKSFDLNLRLSRERTLINGRADAVYNRFVIEYEPPQSLRKNPTHRHNLHAIDQVKQYLTELERLDRHQKERMAGVVLDGFFYIFVRFRDDHWRIDEPVPVTAQSTETFLRYLLALSTELALTPENLVRDFGENSNTARRLVSTLYRALLSTDHPKVQVLFDQWRLQFSEITGWSESSNLDLPRLVRSFGINDRRVDALRFFFAMHTYYAAFIKLLAVQVATYYMMPKVGTGLRQQASSTTDQLREYLEKMERGGIFREFGINNFLEGDFFGWYLTIWNDELDGALRSLVAELSNYSLVTLDVDPEETRDLLKKLYQNLMPRVIRHALGEYYTPDWLAERLLNQLGYFGDPDKRLLDPACGSGTFLVLALRRLRAFALEQMLSESDVMETALNNIVGFDLNPLAVISARTNYLLALGDLLKYRTGDISIPVYLADSVLTPSQGTTLFTHHTYSFNTAVGRFSLPRTLIDSRYIDPFANLLEESVTVRLSRDQFKVRLLKQFPIDIAKNDVEISVALDLYDQLRLLDEKGIDGIWARIIKNAFAPLFVGQFDFIAGNPPWVNWANLPSDYRDSTQPLWQDYDLFAHTGLRARLGSAMDDISILMFYIAIDKYLRATGKLGFVITQSLFKTVGGGEGFRRFQVGKREFVEVLLVDDLSSFQPFDGATNRTSVIVVLKGRQTAYPVTYNMWRKAEKGTSISYNDSLEQVTRSMNIQELVAIPMIPSKYNSPWFTGRPKAWDALQKIIGPSRYQARVGVHCHGNGFYWLETVTVRPDGLWVMTNVADSGRKAIETVEMALEPDLIFPLLRGRDVQRWRAEPEYSILVPHKSEKQNMAIGVEELAITFPKTYRYLEYFKEQLKERSGYKQYFDPSKAPYYSLYNVGSYTFSPNKVVWREVASSLTAAVVTTHDSRIIVPDHKLTLTAVESLNEAHYLCAILNSAPSRLLISAYAITTQISTHLYSYLAIPQYISGNSLHEELAESSQNAHVAAGAGIDCEEIEGVIDALVAKLWGLSDEEIMDIRESLDSMR